MQLRRPQAFVYNGWATVCPPQCRQCNPQFAVRVCGLVQVLPEKFILGHSYLVGPGAQRMAERTVMMSCLLYSWIGPRRELGLTLAFGLSVSDFNSESRFGILTKNYTKDFRWIFEKSRIEFADFFVSALWCNWIFFRFRRFASTMVALPSFLGESVPDGGK